MTMTTVTEHTDNTEHQASSLKKQLERLQVVNEIALAVNRLDLEQVLHVVYQRLNKLIGIRHFFVGLYDAPTRQLTLSAVYDDDQLLPNRVVVLGDEPSFSAWVIDNRKTLALDSSATSRTPKHIQPYGERTRSCVFVPLQVYDQVVGVLSVQSKVIAHFAPEDIAMLESIAAQTAVAIYNATLHAETQKRLREVSSLHLLAEHIANESDPLRVSQTLVMHLHAIFTASCSLLVWEENALPRLEAFAPDTQDTPHLATPFFQHLQQHADALTVYNAEEQQLPATPQGFVSFMAASLVVDEQTRGWLIVASDTPNHFSQAQTDLLKIAAANGAAAIRNSQLLQETQQRAIDLKAAYDELQQLDRLRQEIVENVSHELRSPLSYARAYVGLMALGELGDINKAQEDALKIIDRKTNHMLRLINDILEVEKIRPETLHRRPESISTILQQSYQSARLAYMTNAVTIELACTDADLTLNIDALRIEQVLSNLISNAVKFSPENGVVTIDCKPTDTLFWISVHDQGEGIPPDKLEQIFERFYRVPGVSTEGIGIGLAIVKQIITAHGGQIEVESTPTTGTRFAVGLPIEA